MCSAFDVTPWCDTSGKNSKVPIYILATDDLKVCVTPDHEMEGLVNNDPA